MLIIVGGKLPNCRGEMFHLTPFSQFFSYGATTCLPKFLPSKRYLRNDAEKLSKHHGVFQSMRLSVSLTAKSYTLSALRHLSRSERKASPQTTSPIKSPLLKNAYGNFKQNIYSGLIYNCGIIISVGCPYSGVVKFSV